MTKKKCTRLIEFKKKSPTANKTLYDAVKNLFMAIARALMWSLLFYVAMIYASFFSSVPASLMLRIDVGRSAQCCCFLLLISSFLMLIAFEAEGAK